MLGATPSGHAQLSSPNSIRSMGEVRVRLHGHRTRYGEGNRTMFLQETPVREGLTNDVRFK